MSSFRPSCSGRIQLLVRVTCVIVALATSSLLAQSGAGGRSPGATAQPTAQGPQRLLDRLHQSTRPGRHLGTFRWRDFEATITDVGFGFQNPDGVSCYWFGQLEEIQLEQRPSDPKSGRVRGILGWRRDDIRPITIVAPAEAGDFARFEKALRAAHQAWGAKYVDVAARLKSASQRGGFGDVATQARPGWYNDETKTVTCDDALTPQTAAQMPGGMSVGSTWIGTIEANPIKLQITSVSGATMTYNGVKETLELQIRLDGEIVLRGVAYEFLPGTIERPFKLDTFRARLSADLQSLVGTWKDAGTGSGQWSVSRPKQ
jgi:hypothetical protein